MDTMAHGPHGAAPAALGARLDDPRRGRTANAAERAARRVAIADRRQKTVALYLNKIPQFEIARKLGVSRATVSSDLSWIRAVWIREARDNIGEVILRELATLDADEARLRTKMVSASTEDLALRYYQTILQLMARRARLLGLDAPERIEHSGTITEERIDVRAILLDPAAAALAADLVRHANTQAAPQALTGPKPFSAAARAAAADDEEDVIV